MNNYIFVTQPDLNCSWSGQHLSSDLHAVYENTGFTVTDLYVVEGTGISLKIETVLGYCTGYIKESSLNYHTLRTVCRDNCTFTDFNTLKWVNKLNTFNPYNYKILPERSVLGKYNDRLNRTGETLVERIRFNNYQEILIFLGNNTDIQVSPEKLALLRELNDGVDSQIFRDNADFLLSFNRSELKIPSLDLTQSEKALIDNLLVNSKLVEHKVDVFPLSKKILNSDRSWITYALKSGKNPKDPERLFELKDKMKRLVNRTRNTEVPIQTMSINTKLKYLDTLNFSHGSKGDIIRKKYYEHMGTVYNALKAREKISKISDLLGYDILSKGII